MKKLILLLFIITGCATVDPTILDTQHKILGAKYVKNNVHYFQFLDGTVLVVDERTYHDFREMQTVKLVWSKK